MKKGVVLLSMLLWPAVTVAQPIELRSAIWSGNHHEYKVYQFSGWDSGGRIDWFYAREIVFTMPGYHLVVITTSEEQQWIARTLMAGLTHEYWTGAVQQQDVTPCNDDPYTTPVDPAADWVWWTGVPWSYTAWWSGEPNDHWGCGSEQAVAIWDMYDWGWNDERPDAYGDIRGFIVESMDPMIPDIAIDPASLEFGNVEWQQSSALRVTVLNGGHRDLVVSSVQLKVADQAFVVVGPTAFTLGPDASQDVEVRFTPPDFAAYSNVLEIASNDPDEALVTASVNGTGSVAAVPSDQVADITQRIDTSIDSGAISGTGSGNSADGRVAALKNMVTAAGDLIAAGRIEEACEQLEATYRKCDGKMPPPDFITGEGTDTVAWMILQLKATAGCK